MELETWHIVVGLIIVALVFLCSKNEGYKNFCGNCRDLSLEQCANCANCGIHIDDNGCMKCVQGDEAGPYFQNDAIDWKHMGKTPNNKCWNYDKYSPYNCGYYYPYNKRVILHQKFASMPEQLGTLSYDLNNDEKTREFLKKREKYLSKE